MRLFRLPPTEALLRIALAFAFIYPALDAYNDPTSWLGYIPAFTISAFHVVSIPLKLSNVVLLHLFGLVEIILAVWVLFGRRVRTPALIMSIILFVIVLTNLDHSNFSVVFRDVSIAFAGLALFTLRRP